MHVCLTGTGLHLRGSLARHLGHLILLLKLLSKFLSETFRNLLHCVLLLNLVMKIAIETYLLICLYKHGIVSNGPIMNL